MRGFRLFVIVLVERNPEDGVDGLLGRPLQLDELLLPDLVHFGHIVQLELEQHVQPL